MPAREDKPGATAKRRIVLVDDHALLRRGLKSLIETEPDLVVCAEAGTRQAGLDVIAATKPDLVIADLSLKDSDGLEMIKDLKVRFPNFRCWRSPCTRRRLMPSARCAPGRSAT